MNELKIFKKEGFGEIRTLDIDGEPWFVGKDVTNILGYHNSRKAISDHVDEEDRGVTKCDTLGGTQELTIINESGLYSLILSSKLPTAKAFKKWVTSEVLLAIRKDGLIGLVKCHPLYKPKNKKLDFVATKLYNDCSDKERRITICRQ